MDNKAALDAFTALSQETRLNVFRLLVEYGPQGVAAGVLSDNLGIPHNTLSFHLSHLAQAGLVTSRKAGRSVIYAANCDLMESLIAFLRQNCCTRDDSAQSNACCPPASTKG